MKTQGALLGLMCLVLAAGTAAAEPTWSDKVNYRYSGQTSIKVTEPEGFKVTVTLGDGSEQAGTVPELFRLPDQDAFIKVTLVPTDGSKPWSKKIEVRAKQQTELAVGFKPDDSKPAPAKAAARSYIGRMVNKAGGCGQAWRRSIRTVFVRKDDGSEATSVQIDHGKNVDVTVSAGSYDVRVFIWNGKEWKFVLTSSHDVSKDGWTLGFGCQPGKHDPTVLAL